MAKINFYQCSSKFQYINSDLWKFRLVVTLAGYHIKPWLAVKWSRWLFSFTNSWTPHVHFAGSLKDEWPMAMSLAEGKAFKLESSSWSSISWKISGMQGALSNVNLVLVNHGFHIVSCKQPFKFGLPAIPVFTKHCQRLECKPFSSSPILWILVQNNQSWNSLLIGTGPMT